jgi:hypothetical protein
MSSRRPGQSGRCIGQPESDTRISAGLRKFRCALQFPAGPLPILPTCGRVECVVPRRFAGAFEATRRVLAESRDPIRVVDADRPSEPCKYRPRRTPCNRLNCFFACVERPSPVSRGRTLFGGATPDGPLGPESRGAGVGRSPARDGVDGPHGRFNSFGGLWALLRAGVESPSCERFPLVCWIRLARCRPSSRTRVWT